MSNDISGRYGRSYISGLFGLRALAAVAVVAYHFFPYTVTGGYLGVCLFFVLSGFLLAGKGTLELSRREFSIGDFYRKRLRRIYPSLLLFLFVTYLALYFVQPDIIRGTREEFFSAIFGYHNWWQIATQGSYFSQLSSVSPFKHLWSLAMELQFYLIYPLVFFLFLYLLKKFRKKTALMIFGILVALTAVPMAVAELVGVEASRLYYGTDLRFFAILFGMFAGFLRVGISRSGELAHRRLYGAAVCICMALMLLCFLVVDGQWEITYLGGMQAVCLVMSFLVFAVADGRLLVTRVLELAPLRWIGSRSYEIYLWHYPFVAYLQYNKLMGNPVYVTVVLAISLLLAECSYRLTNAAESRLSDAASRRTAAGRAVAVLTIILVVAGGGFSYAAAGGEKFDTSALEVELSENSELLAQQGADEEDGSAFDEGGITGGDAEDEETETSDDGADAEASDGESDDTGTYTEEVSEPSTDISSMTIIGDSVTLGAVPQLMEYFPDAYIDAEQSRQVRGSLDLIKRLDSEDRLGETVVYILGVNGPFLVRDGQEIIDYLGTDRRVFWVNAYGAHIEWQDRVNDVIAAICATNINVSKIDWAKEAEQHPDWFYDDGVHLNKDGQAGFAAFLYDQIVFAD